MTRPNTFRAQLPCPDCDRESLLTVCVLGGHADGRHDGRIAECSNCWQRRALLIATAKSRLRATGDFATWGGSGQETWLGVPLSRDDDDAFESALQSELLRLGVPTAEARDEAARVSVLVTGGQHRVLTDELVPASA
jgi:hypothetical protein